MSKEKTGFKHTSTRVLALGVILVVLAGLPFGRSEDEVLGVIVGTIGLGMVLFGLLVTAIRMGTREGKS